MIGPGGDGYVTVLWIVFIVPKVAFWVWLVVRAGKLGRRQGERRRTESTVVDERLRRIDRGTASSLRRSDD